MNNSVLTTVQIRHDISTLWTQRNPRLENGEYGLETDTFLIKIGNGVDNWNDLPYLNKLDASYFKQTADGTLTFSDAFLNTIDALNGGAVDSLTINNLPTNDTDAANKAYVDQAVRQAGHLKREVVIELPAISEADADTMYMVLAPTEDHYIEYMLINGAWDSVGTTGDGGNSTYELPVATTALLGGVKASDDIAVDANGVMTLSRLSTSLLYVPTGDTFTINGGSA